MKQLLAAAIGVFMAITGAATAHADDDPTGPGVGVCSFQGEYFTQYYWCTQPPAWLLQPHSDEARPGPGTSNSPFAQ